MHVQSPSRPRLADLALIAYLAPLVQGRRVAVVGPASGDVARRARALGATSVVSFGGAGEDLAVRALTPGALAGFHGKLDLVVIPSAGAVPSLVAVLDEARRALGSEGVVVVASEPEDGAPTLESGALRAAGHDALRELCQQRFASVQLLGRGPFLGYTVASLSEGAERVGLETRLIDGDPPQPEAFIAVASDSPCALDPLTVVQVPTAVLDTLRADATRALEEALAQRDQKLKEAENASAEKWVRLQRLEHQYKELEEEARKARERAVRASKDLEDERKLRQRIELEGQMARRAPELPKAPEPDPEVPALRARVSELERELDARRAEGVRAQEAHAQVQEAHARAQVAHAQAQEAQGQALAAALARVQDLECELDETHAAEAELRAQLDEAIDRPTIPPAAPARDTREEDRLRGRLEGAEAELRAAHAEAERAREERAAEHAALESSLARSAGEVLRLGHEKGRLEEAVRELCLAADRAAGDDLRARLDASEAQRLQARRVHGALADCADALAHENDVLRERLAATEAHAAALSTEAAAAVARGKVLEADLARAQEHTPEATPEEVQGLRHELESLLVKDAVGSGQLAGYRVRARELEACVVELERALTDARAAGDFDRRAALEARNEVARSYAQNVGAEARLTHIQVEFEGAQAGARRRIAELEGEVERLVGALEVAGTQTAFEAGALEDSQTRELEGLRAEREGLSFRVREAERALAAARSLREERAEAQARAGAAEAAVASLESVRAALTVERDALADRLEISEAERGAAMGRLAAASRERDASRDALDASRAARDALQGAVLARALAEARVSEAEGRLAAAASERVARAQEAAGALQAERAEREGLRFRLREAETALDARAADADRRVLDAVARVSALEAERNLRLAAAQAPAADEGSASRVDQLLTDLSATATRLGETEEALVAARAELAAAVAAQALLRGQLDERDLRLAALERRLKDDLTTMQRSLSQESQTNVRLRASLEGVRSGLSSILIDGRGAVVAHDLVMLLRQIEGTG